MVKLNFSKKTASSSEEIKELVFEKVADEIAPKVIEADFNYLKIDDRYYQTLFVTNYPRFVSANWLSPLIDFEHEMHISFFIYPINSTDVLSQMQRKIAEMEATLYSDNDRGKVMNPKVSSALEDALSIQESLAKGVERLFQFGLYITISDNSIEDLQKLSKQLSATLGSLLLGIEPATLQMDDGFKTTLPMGKDRISVTHNMDTTSLASTFPFSSASLTQNKGILYGLNKQNSSLVIFDRFSLENANEIIFGKSGSGKSYLIKLEILRSFMFGSEVIVIDPEDEYKDVVKTLDGEYLIFSQNSPIKINPFDLSGIYEEGENELGLKILSLHGLLKIFLGNLDAEHDAVLDRALMETYRQKGITTDPETQKNTPPLMEDLYKVLIGMEDQTSKELALGLEKFIKGSLIGIFNQQSNFDIKNPFTVFNIKSLEEELRPIAMHVILDFVWTKVKKTLKKRLLVLDEAWYMMKYEDSASFVYGVAKRARKYYLALSTATQDVEDFLSTDYGKAVLSNSSIQMLLKQSPTEIDLVAEIFYLTAGEKQLLLSANPGEGLFFAGQSHVSMQVIAAPFEHKIITSNPEEMEEIKKQAKEEVEAEKKAIEEKVKQTEEKPPAKVELPDPKPELKDKPKIIMD